MDRGALLGGHARIYRERGPHRAQASADGHTRELRREHRGRLAKLLLQLDQADVRLRLQNSLIPSTKSTKKKNIFLAITPLFSSFILFHFLLHCSNFFFNQNFEKKKTKIKKF
jgi:hypothetical protein